MADLDATKSENPTSPVAMLPRRRMHHLTPMMPGASTSEDLHPIDKATDEVRDLTLGQLAVT